MKCTHLFASRYYRRHGPITDPGEFSHLLDGLPSDLPALCHILQGSLVHIFWAQRYGLDLTEERKREVSLRTVPRMLARLQSLQPQPLAGVSPLDTRLVGNCRDFSVMLCAMLRHQGVAARARCGFGTYFRPGWYEDHWVCEYSPPGQERWAMADPQLDEMQRQVLNVTFDPLDMPPRQFLPAGEAWLMCRRGEADPQRFGIFEMRGLGFIGGNVIRDFLALNRIELLPWDQWGMMGDFDAGADACDRLAKELDLLAELTLAGDPALPQLQAILTEDARLRIPEDWQP